MYSSGWSKGMGDHEMSVPARAIVEAWHRRSLTSILRGKLQSGQWSRAWEREGIPHLPEACSLWEGNAPPAPLPQTMPRELVESQLISRWLQLPLYKMRMTMLTSLWKVLGEGDM